MSGVRLPRKAGGVAVVFGYLLLFLVLFRDPGSGIAAALERPRSMLFFVILPVLGLGVGIYTYLDGPYSGVPLFLMASYLGLFGLTLAIGFGRTSGTLGVLQGIGLVLVIVSAVSLLVSVKLLAAYLHLDTMISPPSDRSPP